MVNILKEKHGVRLVYDGECPVCTYAAEALRVKQDCGELFTINAREHANNPLVEEVNRLGLDLDEGMVIYANDQFYHGNDALKFMAKYGESKNAFMTVLKGLFWSDTLSRLMYPWLRGVRNWFLLRKNVSCIDNLNLKHQPIFKSVFGQSWQELPAVMKKRYANCPYTQEQIRAKGTLDVSCEPPLLWLSPLMKLLGQIPTYNEGHVPVTVHFQSDQNSKSFHVIRIFNFRKGKPYKFQSRMLQLKNNEVIEMMRFGLGWKMQYSWDGEKVVMAHKGYVLQLFGHFIPLPITTLMGTVYAEERPVNDNTFDMTTQISHPWWGRIYENKGRFELLN